MDSLKSKIEVYERQAITGALQECGWIKARAAKKLGITERMIGYKIRKYGIQKEINTSAMKVENIDDVSS